jgi:hypothetical protein
VIEEADKSAIKLITARANFFFGLGVVLGLCLAGFVASVAKLLT